jgi:hypothetical protein
LDQSSEKNIPQISAAAVIMIFFIAVSVADDHKSAPDMSRSQMQVAQGCSYAASFRDVGSPPGVPRPPAAGLKPRGPLPNSV